MNLIRSQNLSLWGRTHGVTVLNCPSHGCKDARYDKYDACEVVTGV